MVQSKSSRKKGERVHMKKYSVKPEDLYKFKLINDCEISNDGKLAVYSLVQIDKKEDKKVANLFLIDIKSGKVRQFTTGKSFDHFARFSPCGNFIAFLSNREDEKQYQLYLIPVAGGEAEKLTQLHGKFLYYEWSPDSKKILINFIKKDKEDIELEKKNKKREYRLITKLFYKHDGEGFLSNARSHIFLFDIKSRNLKQLTNDFHYEERYPTFSKDGKKIIFCSNRSKNPELNVDADDIFIMNLKTLKTKKLKTLEGPKQHPVFSKDENYILFIGKEGRTDWWRHNCLFKLDLKTNKLVNLTKKYDINLSSTTINDIGGLAGVNKPIIDNDGNIYFQATVKGSTLIYKLSSQNELSIFDKSETKGVYSKFSIDKDSNKMLFVKGDELNPADIYCYDFKTKKSKRLTFINMNLLKRKHLGKFEEVWIKVKSGKLIHGFIIKPPEFDKTKKYPAILEIHGGPMCQYGYYFMHEFYYLAENGYVVFFCNPTGSDGYGENSLKEIYSNWGHTPYQDLMDFTDYIVKLPYIDKNRLGVTGGSYGGYMTNWIIAHTNRFKAAVTQRSVSNLISMYGTSDFNFTLEFEFGKRPPFEIMKLYWEQSPIAYFKHVKTPTLVIHSGKDYRTPVGEGEQVFVALKRMKVETEFLLFFNESHGLSRSGKTLNRIVRLKHILRWFDKYLKK